MKVIIAGSRTFDDYEKLKQKCDFLLHNIKDIEIVSGNAAGADLLGERYARERGYKLYLYPADWEKYGRRAGYVRNSAMAKNADALIAFWNGISSGTKMMIDIARKEGLKVKIVYV